MWGPCPRHRHVLTLHGGDTRHNVYLLAIQVSLDSLRERESQLICIEREEEVAWREGGAAKESYGVHELLHPHLHSTQTLGCTLPPPARS